MRAARTTGTSLPSMWFLGLACHFPGDSVSHPPDSEHRANQNDSDEVFQRHPKDRRNNDQRIACHHVVFDGDCQKAIGKYRHPNTAAGISAIPAPGCSCAIAR